MDNHNTSEHHEGCSCGHGHHQTITLTLTDNSQMKCSVLSIFEHQGKEYIALLPEGGETVMLYSFREVDGAPELNNIESDEEYEMAGQVFMDSYRE